MEIVQLSDIHVGAQFRADIFEKVIEEVNSLNPDAVVITGDLTNEGLKEQYEKCKTLISKINVYVDKQAPWMLKKSDEIRMKIVLSVSIELIKRSTLLLFPIMPGSCLKVFEILNINFNEINLINIANFSTKSRYLNKVSAIFPRINIDD